jgi:hypothetical protein
MELPFSWHISLRLVHSFSCTHLFVVLSFS